MTSKEMQSPPPQIKAGYGMQKESLAIIIMEKHQFIATAVVEYKHYEFTW